MIALTAMSHTDRFLLAGVMGDPVMHSRSPKLHNYWLAKYGLTGAYMPLAIAREHLRAALRALPALGFSGCNLTIPHKEAALKIVDTVDPLARRIGAVNCVVVAADGSLEGQNHDACGDAGQRHQPGHGRRAALGSGAQSLAGERARVRHRLYSARDGAHRRCAHARQPDAERARHAAAPGAAGLPGVVRNHARGDAGAARDD